MKTSRRSLCIVSCDPLQCSELVLSLQASLDPDDEVEIVMDRRRARDVFDTKSGAPEPVSGRAPPQSGRRSRGEDQGLRDRAGRADDVSPSGGA